MTAYVSHTGWSLRLLPGEDLELVRAQVAAVMDQLLDLEASEGMVNSSAVALDLKQLLVEIDLGVEAPSMDEGRRIVDEAIRRAILMAGGNVLSREAEPTQKRTELMAAAL